jgi:hypothetical protein
MTKLVRAAEHSDRMHFYIAPRKIAEVHGIAWAILRQARQGRRWVSRDRLRSFCGVCVSLSLAMPFSRFYTRNLFDDMARRPREGRASRNGNRCRLSHQSIRDLQMWRKLASTETDGRTIRPLPTNGIMPTDAADVGLWWNAGHCGCSAARTNLVVIVMSTITVVY